MPLARFKDLCVDVVDLRVMAPFWASALGLTPDPEPREGLARLVGPDPSQSVWLNAVPEPKTVKNRVHWDVDVASAAAVDELVARGASVLRTPDDDISWTVLADPEGNEFCAFTDA